MSGCIDFATMSTVYLATATHDEPEHETERKIVALWRAAGFDAIFAKNDLAAVKLHVGEPGTTTFVAPGIVRSLVGCIAARGARPFLTDTAVLYKSPRDTGVGHARVAADHGFTLERVGAPFIPADGLQGADEIKVEVEGGKHFKEVGIAAAIMQARSMLVVTHATGHLAVGYGGALKNLGMGCAAKKGKLKQHHGQAPRIDAGACTACGTCAEWCPAEAITVTTAALIDAGRCIGCGECVATCRDGAVDFDWSVGGAELQERIVEHAAAVVRGKPKQIGYITVAESITKDCDCMGRPQAPVCADIGILASRDPVAIDQAVMDLVREQTGRRLEALAYPKRDGTVQIGYATRLGLGEATVELVRVDE
jgi:hypothetical protein